MTHLTSFEGRIKTIEVLTKKLASQKLSPEELDELVVASRDLYERSVILQYKAFEEKVFGVKDEVEVIEEKVELDKPEPETIVAEEPVVETIEEIQEEELTAFDFSLFEEPLNAVIETELKEEEEEHISISHSISENNGVIEEKTIIEEVKISHSPAEVDALAAKFAKEVKQAATGFQLPKIETLVGSFGLNERLQFINELFDGSSESFADAIKIIDNLSSHDDAFRQAANFAIQYNWEKDSETVTDFLTKIQRRYA
jgi:hypothetical protein